ncbi:AfsR/SARP family transcriptional regulator [Streptomyces sp. NBC_00539]|uniref:AfsR/SARP family transcriptional regulator n=1 Tax=Streptomyces sp. NBC_00539 TaxID=2975770 RepID=UPI002E7FFA22|nr:BTAD domain-containing putative transcriptional regulator [Streptomyces sp. NBC_00539]WUC63998.1 winged helix-turn-helix domain-containing protein [Streptomyces sp. NBC_00539]
MLFRILGPLEVCADADPGTSHAPHAAKLRVVLGTLLVRADEVVSVGTLIDELWPDAPPRTATTTLQVYVSHLRKVLRGADPDHGGAALVTRRPGYVLRVGARALDTMAFEELTRRGHRALREGDFAGAAESHRQALALWRGPVLSDTPHGPVLDGAAVRLNEARVTALDERIRAELHLGRHRDLLAELHELVAEHRLHEEFHAHLMVALYRCGRQAEALRVFTLLRQTLVEELGIEPGPASRELQRRILEGDPALSRPGARETAATTGSGPAAWSAAPGAALPGSDPYFTGRAGELAELERLLRTAPAGGRVAVTGLPGTGKSALAVEAAHRVADAFPDGRLYLDLRADADGPPHRAVDRLPQAGPRRPAGDGPAAGPRRVLLVLDHVASETQVRPLLAAAPDAVVLLTAGRVPAGLPGLRSVVLGPWSREEVPRLAGLFAVRGAPGGVDAADPDAVAETAELCGRLPLAVRAAAAQLAARPHWTIAALADRLREERGRLDALRTGDVDVRARLCAAYAACPAPARRAFRMLGALPPGRFGPREAAAALDVGEREAAVALEALADERLVALERDGCRLPELLRLLAAELLAREEPPEVARAAAERVCRAYADAAAEPGRAPDAAARGLVHLARTAYEAGLWELTVRLTDALGGWVREDLEAAYGLALDAAERCSDRAAQARMLRALADLAWQHRRMERARELYGSALDLARGADDGEEAGRALVGLAELRLDAGAATDAAALLEPALAALTGPGRARGRYEASRTRALLALAQEEPETARAWFRECLELAGALRDHRLEGYARRSLRALGTGPAAGPGGAVEVRPGLWRLCPRPHAAPVRA